MKKLTLRKNSITVIEKSLPSIIIAIGIALALNTSQSINIPAAPTTSLNRIGFPANNTTMHIKTKTVSSNSSVLGITDSPANSTVITIITPSINNTAQQKNYPTNMPSETNISSKSIYVSTPASTLSSKPTSTSTPTIITTPVSIPTSTPISTVQ